MNPLSRIGVLAAAVFAFTLLPCAAVHAFTPMTGSENRLSAGFEGDQQGATIAGYADGSFIAAWGDGPIGNSYPTQFYARRFDAAGAPLGPEFPIATVSVSYQGIGLATRADGGFVVAWNVGGNAELRGRIFAADDSPLSAEFQVNSHMTGDQYGPAIAVRADGRFLVAWTSEDHVDDASETGVRARIFDASGNALAPEFLVNTYTPEYQSYPRVAALSGGNFAIVWGDRGQDGTFFSVFGRLFDGNGAPVTAEFPVHQMSVGLQLPGGIAATSTGGFVVTWQSEYEINNFDSNIYARVFDSAAQPLGPEFQVNTYSDGLQVGAHVSVRSDGAFLVTWFGAGGGNGIFGQLFDASAQPLGSEFRLNSLDPEYKSFVSAFLPNSGGIFHAVWQVSGSMNVDGSGWGVFGTTGCIGDGTDSDGDGVGDACDTCDVPGGHPIGEDFRLHLRFFNDLNPADRLSWSTDFPLPMAWEDIDPTATPIRIRVEGDRYRPLVDVELAATMLGAGVSAGWTQNGAGTRWKYRNRSAEPEDGIVSVLLSTRGGNDARLKVIGKLHPYGIAADETQLQARILLGDARAGECAETTIVPADCAFDGFGRSFNCAQ